MTASCCFSLRSPPCNMPREFGQKQRNLEISAKYFVSLPEKCVSCGGGEANCILIHCGVRGQNIGFRFWHERPKIWVLHACLFSRQFDSIETKQSYILKASLVTQTIPQKNFNFPRICQKMQQKDPKVAKIWPKMAPKWPQMALEGPKMIQSGPKMTQNGPQ